MVKDCMTTKSHSHQHHHIYLSLTIIDISLYPHYFTLHLQNLTILPQDKRGQGHRVPPKQQSLHPATVT